MSDLAWEAVFRQAVAQHEEKIRRKELYDGVDYNTFMHSMGKQRLAAFHINFLTFLFLYCDATA